MSKCKYNHQNMSSRRPQRCRYGSLVSFLSTETFRQLTKRQDVYESIIAGNYMYCCVFVSIHLFTQPWRHQALQTTITTSIDLPLTPFIHPPSDRSSIHLQIINSFTYWSSVQPPTDHSCIHLHFVHPFTYKHIQPSIHPPTDSSFHLHISSFMYPSLTASIHLSIDLFLAS